MKKIVEETKIGNVSLKNRLAMAPMTRSRAQVDGTPGELAAEYYGQRASFGLIITEGTQPSDDGQGYLNTPGIYTQAHIDGWKQVTSRVHQEGGRIFIQLMHAGRVSHPDNTPHHRQPVVPSAIAPGAEMFTAEGMKDIPTPRELSKKEIKEVVNEFRLAAAAAIQAGADGVEIHGANGYLLQQFMSENSNQRTDEYGGTIENRARFAIEVTKAVIEEIGAEKTGIRFSPEGTLNGILEGETGNDLYRYLVKELSGLGMAYLHIMHFGNEPLLKEVRQLWTQPLIVNRMGRPLDQLSVDIDNNLADVASVGIWALANPDFVDRLTKDEPLNDPDPTTLYVGGEKGYTDYPFLTK
ncbi:alkene reductase [Alkalicoccobacillus murimartini]|uniref:2,4-dienoyl-CoA reductase-like NADH-dependent reductase (Old Yellow Enzyme family) n=1 Tax=Alkalicoccobacillus murimartini TaxID=171685 RepID=A0ABT9YHF2_9BACI|nr:alkene reductase [Alkalicoccobacillus murimartini]MDQ0206622.1 2,4-dienoyl-CoA reductase-like NADH-dependent reductase (Old Yellow Enzyme family) [Alkalicoccobacillus murimartini]